MKTVLPIGRTGSVWTLLAAALVTMSVACSSSSGGGESTASCAYRVEYQDHMYAGAEGTGFTLGDKLGAATLPPCNDMPSEENDGQTTPTPTTAYAIEGVDPSIAIALKQASDDVIFVNVDSDRKLSEIQEMFHSS
ncbi:DUF6281 family protein [Streptomyces sp. NPDC058683]|uniref:DUF6281 family protein n=1 Tax=Streptomyces sp. NPDC058683 TaxID=3346597 RepID=UPI00364E03E8